MGGRQGVDVTYMQSMCLRLRTSLRCEMRAQEVKRGERSTPIVNTRSIYLNTRATAISSL